MNTFLRKNPNLILLALTLFSLFLLATSFYFQLVKNLEPCPLCIAQRLSIILLFFIYLIAFFLKKNSYILTNTVFQLLFSFFGAAMAGRQIWISYHPVVGGPGCIPNFSLLWQYLPVSEIVHTFLNGSGSCSDIPWRLLGLTMPEWTLGCFIIFILGAFGFYHSRKST